MKTLNIPEDQAPALWSHRAKLRDLAMVGSTDGMDEATAALGCMYEWNHRRSLDSEEYEYWLYHKLPFGWAVISKPSESSSINKLSQP